jgi:FMN hydrolase / 5-amino-6-(5-phospho-D-ribitylamino)uracil phosphatase
MPTVSAVTFDGDETLWDFQGAMRQALETAAGCYATMGFLRNDSSKVTADWLAEIRDDVARRPEFRRARMEEIRLTAFAEVSSIVGADDDFTRNVFDEYMEARHSEVRLFEDAAECLRALSNEGFRLGLVTNGNSQPARLGIASLFDVIVVAADCGFYKPDPQIYRHTADLLGVQSAACVHVGDHPIEDVRACAAAGMRAVWVNRSSSADEEGLGAWATVRRLRELPELILAALRN